MSNNYTGFDLTMYNLFSLLRQVYYTRGETETNFLSKAGGTVGGNLIIQGNLTINGNQYYIDTEHMHVGDYTITLAKDNTTTLASMCGLVVPKYDGTNYGFFGWDSDGYAYVGDLTNYDGSSAITLANNSSLQKIATIDTSTYGTASDGVMLYDSTNHKFVKAPASGTYVITNGTLAALTIDANPTQNSSNPVQSGGVYDALSGKQDTIDSSHKLSSDNVDDTSATNKFVDSTTLTNLANLFYSSSKSYAVNDVVIYSGKLFVCKTAGSGNTPSTSADTSYWVRVFV